jgi:hypothetical protein
VALLRDDSGFATAINRAAKELGLHPQFVEKDYWVTEVLRSLHRDFAAHFIFKGGTSLSKGYGLIERFSEDIDILVVADAGSSARQRERKLLHIAETVAQSLGLPYREKRAPGRGRDAHRADLLTFEPVVQQSIQTGLDEGGILLETGFAGGREPSEMVEIGTMLCGPLGIEPTEFEDTATFEVRALEPVRTLLEKVCGLHHLATRLLDDPKMEAPRCGRHYWDIDRLLADRAVCRKLEDREGFGELLADVERVSARNFGGITLRPKGGFARGPAFEPPPEIRGTLEGRYDAASVLMPTVAGEEWPGFGFVLGRIARSSDLL